MAAVFDTVDEGLQRTTGLVAASSGFSATWWVYLPDLPTTGVERTLWMVANSANRNTQSICIVQDDTGLVRVVVGGVAASGVAIETGWHFVVVYRHSGTHGVYLTIDGATVSIATAVDFTGWTLNELTLGLDPRDAGGMTAAPSSAAYYREWSVYGVGWAAEKMSPVAVRTADLEMDTPLATDLLDTTAAHHDWTWVGSGTHTFTEVPTPKAGAVGGWWFYSSLLLPFDAHEGIIHVIVKDGLGEIGGDLIARVRVVPTSFTFDGAHYTEVHYKGTLTYTSAPGVETTLEVADPVADPGIGSGPVPFPPRGTWAAAWRWAVVFQCSTYDPDTATFAADGFVQLFLNGAVLAQAIDVTIPVRPDGRGIEYKIGILGDCDRIWARTVAELAPTTSEGAFIGGPPSALVFANEFDSGAYPGWTPTDVSSLGSPSALPNAYSNAGGDNGWGLSVFTTDPTGGGSGTAAGYSALYRFVRFPPQPLPGDGGGGGPATYTLSTDTGSYAWTGVAATLTYEPSVPPDGGGGGGVGSGGTGIPQRRLRRATHITDEQRWMFHDRFQVDLQTGIGLVRGQGSDPQVMIRWSNDGGHTWSDEHWTSAGTIGARRTRALVRQTGRARTRTYEVVVSDSVPWYLAAAYLDISPGNGT